MTQSDYTLHDQAQWLTINRAIQEAQDITWLISSDVLTAYATLSSNHARLQAMALLKGAARRFRAATEMQKALEGAARNEKQRMRQTTSKRTMFSGLDEDEQLWCGDYDAGDGGIFLNDEYGGEKIICWHPIYPARYFRDLHTGEMHVELRYFIEDQWQTYTVSRMLISSRKEIQSLTHLGINATSENAGDLVKYLATLEAYNRQTIPMQVCATRCGWVGEEFSPYIEGLTYIGEDSYDDIFESLKAYGSPDVWRDTVKSFYRSDCRTTIPRIMLAASAAAPLVGYLQGLPFFVHLWGGTGNGKTVSLMLAASVWGAAARSGGLIHSFNSTRVGLERLSACLNNLPVMLDEIGVKSGDDHEMDGIIYELCEGKGRTRGSVDGMRRTATWSTIFVSTGEHPLNSGRSKAGAINRTISISCGGLGDSIYDDVPALLAALDKSHGHAGPDIIRQIRSMGREGCQALIRSADAIIAGASEGVTSKQRIAAGFLMAGDMLMQRYVFGDIVDDGNVEWISSALATEDDVSNFKRALQWLEGWVTANGRHFADSPSETAGMDAWGFIRSDGRMALVPAKLREEMARAGFSYDAFVSDLRDADMLLIDREGRPLTVCRIGNRSVRCLVLNDVLKTGDVPGYIKLLRRSLGDEATNAMS